MAVDVQIPTLGESVSEGVIVRWLKQSGERVAADEPLFELETDKASVEIPAPGPGVITILAQEGATVHVGDVVARIDGDGAAAKPAPVAKPDLEGAAPSAPADSGGGAAASTARATGGSEAAASTAPVKPRASDSAGEEGSAGQSLSPAVRRLVEEHQLDPSQIRGSGRGGRLTKEDVLSHLNAARRQGAPESPPEAPRAGGAAPVVGEAGAAGPSTAESPGAPVQAAAQPPA